MHVTNPMTSNLGKQCVIDAITLHDSNRHCIIVVGGSCGKYDSDRYFSVGCSAVELRFLSLHYSCISNL